MRKLLVNHLIQAEVDSRYKIRHKLINTTHSQHYYRVSLQMWDAIFFVYFLAANTALSRRCNSHATELTN